MNSSRGFVYGLINYSFVAALFLTKMLTLEQEGEEVVGQARCPFESRQSNVGLFAGESIKRNATRAVLIIFNNYKYSRHIEDSSSEFSSNGENQSVAHFLVVF